MWPSCGSRWPLTPRLLLAYLDEVTIERQPTVAAAFAPRGREQPRTERSHAADTLTRVVLC